MTDIEKTDAAIAASEAEYLATGRLHDAAETFEELRAKYLEVRLDEADAAAMADARCFTADEVFARVRNRIGKEKADG